MAERTDVVCLGWWAQGGPLLSVGGLRRLVEVLRDVLPEAVPSRWDVSEDYRFRLADEGLDGLVEFVDSHRWDMLLRAKAPARRVELYPVPASKRDGELRVTSLQVELDAAVLDKMGADLRLPDAFEQIGAVVEPFYGEARMLRGVAKYEGSPLRFHPSVELYPFRWNGWWGLPVKAPFAAMLGSPYRDAWPEFGDDEVAGLAVENRRPWRRDTEDLRWSVPPGLCQVYDPHWQRMDASTLFGARAGFTASVPGLMGPGFQMQSPEVRPSVWPFADGHSDSRPDPLVLLSEALEPDGEGQIRRVAVDDPDGEPFEMWERVAGGNSYALSVWVRKTPEPDWPWRFTFAALEFVRSEPLESDLRGALWTALEQVPGVTDVVSEDREVVLVAGSPAGLALITAATQVIDRFANEIEDHCRQQ